MTIKIEFPADRSDIALAIGQALVTIGGGAAVEPHKQGASSTACDDQFKAEEVSEQHRQGPYYWAHHESESCGSVATWAELQEVLSEPLAEEVSEELYDKLFGKWSALAEDPAPEQSNGSSAKVDSKGVAFNAEFCAKAQDPYYATGKRKGQWKKRKGVSDDAYDDWYCDELSDCNAGGNNTEANSNVAANTFGGQQQQAPDANAPQDAGQLMKWVSEQQAAGNITQQQVTDAYSELKLPFDAVMNPAYPVAENCAAIYYHLKGQI